MPNPPALNNIPLPPGPPVMRPSGHPCNPQFVAGIPKIKVDENRQFNRNAEARPAVPDPNHPGCYKLAQNAGRRKYHSKKHTRRRHTRRRHTRRRHTRRRHTRRRHTRRK
jgi:hypothetical protein